MMLSENYLKRNTSEFALLISDEISAMLAYWDKDLICRFANEAYVEWFGKSKEEMINKMHLRDLLGPLYEKNLHYIKAALSGKRQLFEREIPLPKGGGVRNSLATYIPEIENGEVLGFFVHVADVTYIKNLEKEIINVKRDFLRKTIESEENEKRFLVEILRENINQKMIACKIFLQREHKKGILKDSENELDNLMGEVIQDINSVCQNLTPTEIEILGFRESIESYLIKAAKENKITINFSCKENGIENIVLKDKISIFRIIQYFTKLALDQAKSTTIDLSINFKYPEIKIKFTTNSYLSFNTNSKEYNSILCRVDYYSGEISESQIKSGSTFTIKFSLPQESLL